MKRFRKGFLSVEQGRLPLAFQKSEKTYIQRWMENGVLTFDIALQGLREIPVVAVLTREKGLIRKNLDFARNQAKKNNSSVPVEYFSSAMKQSAFVAQKILRPIQTLSTRWEEIKQIGE